jgi:hypothetical protein
MAAILSRVPTPLRGVELSCRRVVSIVVFVYSTLLAASGATAYEFPVHFSVTVWLAEELAGLTQDQGYEVAKFDQSVDDNPATQPLWSWTGTGYRRRKMFHFVDQERLEALRQVALKCSNDFQAGLYLHALEDVAPHRNHGPGLGHSMLGHTPDKPWYNPPAFVEMIQVKANRLMEVRQKCFGGRTGARTDPARASAIKVELELWSTTEYSFGGGDNPDDQAARWNALISRLFGARYNTYAVDLPRKYRDWAETQKEKGTWWKP